MSETDNVSATSGPEGMVLDPAFFTATNAYLELASQQGAEFGMKRVSMSLLYAAARYNSFAFVNNDAADASAEKTVFLDTMSALFRRMLNENVDNLLENKSSSGNSDPS